MTLLKCMLSERLVSCVCGGGVVGFLFLFLENSAKCHRDQVEAPQNRIQETCAIFAARVPRVPSVISENRDGCEEAVAQTCAIGRNTTCSASDFRKQCEIPSCITLKDRSMQGMCAIFAITSFCAR